MPRVMLDVHAVKPLLKRGALVAAANWEVIVLQFIAESAFKMLLIVPLVGAAFLVALLVGGSGVDIASHDARQVLAVLMSASAQHPAALICYMAGAAVLIIGGAALTFLAKGGTVAVLVRAERRAPPVERPPLRLSVFRRAESFRVERFNAGAQRLFRPYLALGLALMAVYAVFGLAYLLVVYVTYQLAGSTAGTIGWTLLATALSAALVLAVTVVNLLYLLAQIIVAAEHCGVAAALARLGRLLRAEFRDIAMLFLAVLIIVSLATGASILATASLGVVGFVPIVGLAVLPLQIIAWLARGFVFQYLGLTTLCAYVRLYRGTTVFGSSDAVLPAMSPAS